MNKVLAISIALLILGLALGACSPTSIGIQLPGGPDQGGDQPGASAMLYTIILLAVVAVFIALISAISGR